MIEHSESKVQPKSGDKADQPDGNDAGKALQAEAQAIPTNLVRWKERGSKQLYMIGRPELDDTQNITRGAKCRLLGRG